MIFTNKIINQTIEITPKDLLTQELFMEEFGIIECEHITQNHLPLYDSEGYANELSFRTIFRVWNKYAPNGWMISITNSEITEVENESEAIFRRMLED